MNICKEKGEPVSEHHTKMFDYDKELIQEAESQIAKLCYYAARKMSKYQYNNQQKSTPSLGVIRLDYDYPPALGDIDCPESFPYPVYYKVVPGFTFEMCQTGLLTTEVEERFKKSIKWLVDEQRVRGITGDCGFMMHFQKLAREITDIPVFMSSLCQLPAVTCAYAPKEQIIILTANSNALEPLRDLIRAECGVDTFEQRYHIVGCEDIDGFEAVALGEKVDINKVEPGVVNKALEALKMYPESRAFVLECTELPPYADAIRFRTGLPVFDAISACNFFIGGFQDDVRFGLQNWQQKWDGKQEKYEFGDNLTEAEKESLINSLRKLSSCEI